MPSIIAAGSVNMDGTSNASGLFTVQRIDTGKYQVTLSETPSVQPVVVVTGVYTTDDNDFASDNIFTVSYANGGNNTFLVKSSDLYNTAEGTAQYVLQDAPFNLMVALPN